MESACIKLQSYIELCQCSSVGKLLPEALYVHVSALNQLDPELQALEQKARSAVPQVKAATLVKFSFRKPQIAYLFYPDFDTEAHPALQSSIHVGVADSRYEPISVGIGILFKFPQNHTAIQQHPDFRCTAFDSQLGQTSLGTE